MSARRVVARFSSAPQARAFAAVLRRFFKVFAAESGDYVERELDAPWATEAVLPSASALAKKYGARGFHDLTWGDTYLTGIEPVVDVRGAELMISHGYGAEFGKGFLAVLKKAGAKVTAVEDVARAECRWWRANPPKPRGRA